MSKTVKIEGSERIGGINEFETPVRDLQSFQFGGLPATYSGTYKCKVRAGLELPVCGCKGKERSSAGEGFKSLHRNGERDWSSDQFP
ncbi:hypothetical protein N7451_004799 [Penicillium sp. IBT 35674x]|nr:hypothetical protein N7451_004799 [Penicillium sp. IBT 35674x]